MLFAPEFEQRIRKPAAMRQQFVDDGVAGRTDRNQPLLVMDSGFPVMDRPLVPCPTALALKPVSPEDLVAQAGKGAGGMPALPVAGGAEPRNRRQSTAIGAEERFLAKICHGSIIAADNEDYH